MSGVALIRSQNVLDNMMKNQDIAYITDEAARALQGVTVEERDVLINITGDSIARCSVVDPEILPARVNQHVAILRTTSDLDPRFLQRFLVNPSLKDKLLSISSGGTRNALTKADLSNLVVTFPEIKEQQSIADVLGALDDKITANTKLAATADDLLATKFESIVDAQTQLVRLSDLAEVNRSTLKPSPGGLLRYVDIASVGVGSYVFPPATPWAAAPSRARRAIRKGDILWSTVRPNRRSHALNLSNDPLLVGSTGLAVLSARTVGWAYLYEVTRRPEFTSYLETVAEGSAYPAVRADMFGEALVPVSDEASQRSFEQLAEPLREQLHSLYQENRALAATRDALLPQLMSGKLRVKDAEKVLENAGV
ncbi:restriction endonuclease subunit S [Paenarthrobacter sp. 2TAF44]|uniref:restriction endonuclease subunit S n=1 Tax=Paenarthrobacter sp. 2TAF44 TaxID=3233018 RepID=UPI003F9B77F3